MAAIARRHEALDTFNYAIPIPSSRSDPDPLPYRAEPRLKPDVDYSQQPWFAIPKYARTHNREILIVLNMIPTILTFSYKISLELSHILTNLP
jgi:hypothetical protein